MSAFIRVVPVPATAETTLPREKSAAAGLGAVAKFGPQRHYD